MEIPILATPINMAALEIADDYVSGTQGQAYVSIVASNHSTEKQFGAF